MVTEVYKTSLATEYVAILIVHSIAIAEDTIKLRQAVASTLKVMQTQLSHVLDASEQTVKAQSLFHSSLQGRIMSALKMK